MADAISWRDAYRDVLNEVNNDNLTEAIHVAEGAIYIRWQELEGSADHHAEREEIKAASASLLLMKVFELGWPSPTSTYPLDWIHPNKNKTRDEFSED
jgi:hypothetical protein